MEERLPVEFDPARFDEFWRIYPRKVGKGQARKAWLSAGRKVADFTIILALNSQLSAGMFEKEVQFIPHPSTWLNGERWSDQIVAKQRPVYRNGALELLAREMEGQWREPTDGVGDDLRYLGAAPDA